MNYTIRNELLKLIREDKEFRQEVLNLVSNNIDLSISAEESNDSCSSASNYIEVELSFNEINKENKDTNDIVVGDSM